VLKVLRWIGDAIWVYLIPIVIVLNVVQPPLAFLVFGTLGLILLLSLAALLFAVLASFRVLLLLTQRRSGTPDQRG
jgi:hypothetical protein